MLMLNTLLLAFFGMLPLLVIPVRYIVVAGLWASVAIHSPFFVAVGQAFA